ncbi:methionine synthase [Pseudohalocynthiibacter aestuariivivens]|uniref:Methionine synthase n=1 Tax=Roseovarius pelagicus TaxID=2980108 RepID=A0ABY6DC27_9RHOB|nr:MULTISPECIES: methionine synthase [Rhodobacterales]QIE44683.1 methionine synthase [Pseudohalocynthiibacter aestuariivivens]UXX83409.1 methionine synthase [Roseovarius pelagicus]
MRRISRVILIIIAGVGAISWPIFYIWVMGMACAFGSPNTSSCRTRLPWELRGEDLDWLVLRPGALLLAVLLAIYLLRPRPQNNAS